MIDINWLAVLVATVVTFTMGALWFSPLLFGRTWMQLLGLTDKDMRAMRFTPLQAMLIGFITTAISMTALAVLIKLIGVTGAGPGMLVGAFVWLGFLAPVGLGVVLWEGKPFSLWVLVNAEGLLALLVTGAILGAWV